MWTTEFGRLPISQGLGEGGRDHNAEGFTCFLAGAGHTTLYDLHATILHLLGLDHTKLTYYHNGIQRRLTDVHGHVMRELLA